MAIPETTTKVADYKPYNFMASRVRGEDLTGPEGLLKSITTTVLETALEEELTE